MLAVMKKLILRIKAAMVTSSRHPTHSESKNIKDDNGWSPFKSGISDSSFLVQFWSLMNPF